MTAPLKRLLSIGSQKNSRKTPAMIANGFQMLFQSIMEGGDSSASASLASSSCEFLFAVAEILLNGFNLPGSSGARLASEDGLKSDLIQDINRPPVKRYICDLTIHKS